MELSERELLILDEFMYSNVAPSSEGMTLQQATERFVDSSGNVSVNMVQQAIDSGELSLTGDLKGKPEAYAHILSEIRSDSSLSTLTIDRTTAEYEGSIRGACFVDPSGDATVAFRGTGGSYQQWYNNFEGYGDASQQSERDAAAFIQSLPYNNITVTGHSNGGNQAMYATVLCGDKIDRCVSYEGQGGSKEFLTQYSAEIAANKDKITNICGSADIVSPVLKDFAGHTYYVESDSVCIMKGLNHGGYGILTAGDRNGSFDSNGNFDRETAFVDQSGFAKAIGVVTDIMADLSDVPIVGPTLELLADVLGGFIGMGISGNLLLNFFDLDSWKAHLNHLGGMLKSVGTYVLRIRGDVINLFNNGVNTIISFGEKVYDGFKSFIGGLFGAGKTTADSGGEHGFSGGNANVIKVSTEDMEACIARYMNEKARLMDALSICNSAAQTLARSWAGPSFLQMSLRLANTWKNLSQSMALIDDAVNELKKTISILEQTEKSVKASAASLDMGVSPFA